MTKAPLSRLSGEFRVRRLVVGFYRSEEHAEEALREARKNGFFRSAAVHRAEDGGLKYFHAGLAPAVRACVALAFAAALALAVKVAGLSMQASIAFGAGGFLIGWYGTLWLGLGIGKKVLADYSSFVLSGESLVAVEATEGTSLRRHFGTAPRVASSGFYDARRPSRHIGTSRVRNQRHGQRSQPRTCRGMPKNLLRRTRPDLRRSHLQCCRCYVPANRLLSAPILI